MIRKSKVRYWTLFCPKYCAASGVAPASATAATAAAIRRMGIILSTRRPTRRRACPRRAPGRRPTGARAGKTPAAQGGTRAPRSPRSRATPTALAPDPEVAHLADRLGEVHLALVHVDPQLFELALDVARRDRAVQLVLLADFDGKAQMHVGELGRLGFGGAPLGGALPRDARGFVRDLLLIGLGGGVGEALGEEVVAGVAVLDLDDVAGRPEMLHVFSQNDLHRILFADGSGPSLQAAPEFEPRVGDAQGREAG